MLGIISNSLSDADSAAACLQPQKGSTNRYSKRAVSADGSFHESRSKSVALLASSVNPLLFRTRAKGPELEYTYLSMYGI